MYLNNLFKLTLVIELLILAHGYTPCCIITCLKAAAQNACRFFIFYSYTVPLQHTLDTLIVFQLLKQPARTVLDILSSLL